VGVHGVLLVLAVNQSGHIESGVEFEKGYQILGIEELNIQ